MGGNSLFQTVLSGYVHASPDLEVKNFIHAGKEVSGVSTSVALKEGEDVIVLPLEMQMRSPWTATRGDIPTRFKVLNSDISRLSFWLAEQREKMAPGFKPGNQDWKMAWVNSLPTTEEYRNAGLPILAPSDELKTMARLPKFSKIAAKVQADQDEVAGDLAKYNDAAARKLTLDDALWGRASVHSRGMQFGKCAPMTIVPVADMINNDDQDPNVESVA